MKLIVGLGNPEKIYFNTRHNLGYIVVDELAKRLKIKFSKEKKLKSKIARGKLDDKDFCLVKPLTFMNLSGEAVKCLLEHFKLEAKDILVIFDDINLPPGKIRIREKGTSGGHRGVDSIIRILNTNQFPRLRIGIGKPENENYAEYVLSECLNEEKELIKIAVKKAADAVEVYLKEGIVSCMNKYNSNG